MRKSRTIGVIGICIIFMIIFIRSLPEALYFQSLPFIQGYFHARLEQTQLTVIVFCLLLAFSQLVFGSLSDKYGRKIILIIGLAILTVSSILCVYA